MQRHAMGLAIVSVLAITAFILSIALRHYMITYSIVIITFFAGGAYVVAVAKFRDRMDPDDDRDMPKPAPPPRRRHT